MKVTFRNLTLDWREARIVEAILSQRKAGTGSFKPPVPGLAGYLAGYFFGTTRVNST